MKIVLIPHLPTLYGRRYNLAKTLAEQGHEVHFISWDMPYPLSNEILAHLFNSWKSETYRYDNFTVHRVKRLPLFWPIINGVIFKAQIKKLYNRYGADLILSQSFTNETSSPTGLPLIYDINDDHMAYANIYGSWFYKLGYKVLGVRRTIERQARQALLVSVVSDKLLHAAQKYNINVIKIPNGVEKLAFHIKKQKAKEHSLVYVSTFGKWSRILDVIGLVDSLKQQIHNIHLDLVGDGTEFKNASKKIKELGLENWITLHGKISNRSKLLKMIAAHDVCLNISEKNAFRDAASPIKVIEYAALGKKVVSTDLDEVKALKLPNIFFVSNKQGNRGLELAVLKAFRSKAVYTAASRLWLEQTYTWNAVCTNLLTALDESIQGEHGAIKS